MNKGPVSLRCYKVISFSQPREWTAKQDYSMGHCDETFLKPANQLKMADRRKLKETRLALDVNHHCSVFVIFLKKGTTTTYFFTVIWNNAVVTKDKKANLPYLSYTSRGLIIHFQMARAFVGLYPSMVVLTLPQQNRSWSQYFPDSKTNVANDILELCFCLF